MLKPIGAFLCLTLALAACNPTDAKDLQSDARNLADTATRAAANASVAAKVSTALNLRKGVHLEGIDIDSEAGTVTISGEVETQEEKDLILEIAQETRGVEEVVDEIRVEPKD